jgi:hypothetical protein
LHRAGLASDSIRCEYLLSSAGPKVYGIKEAGMLMIALLCLTAWTEAEEARLPGSDLTVAEAGKRADMIAVARAIKFRVGIGSHDQLACSGFEVKTSGTIKGSLRGQEMRTVSFIVKGYSVDDRPQQKGEEIPRVGDDYIFFIKKIGKTYHVIKVLRKTKENLQAVGGEP